MKNLSKSDFIIALRELYGDAPTQSEINTIKVCRCGQPHCSGWTIKMQPRDDTIRLRV